MKSKVRASFQMPEFAPLRVLILSPPSQPQRSSLSGMWRGLPAL